MAPAYRYSHRQHKMQRQRHEKVSIAVGAISRRENTIHKTSNR